jgi:hypothetical protein
MTIGYFVGREQGDRSRISTRRCSTCSASTTRRLTFYHNGINRRLTDVHGTVLNEILT